jgi:protoporphyrinogen oxidase
MVVDSVVIRMPKAYPAYLGTFRDFSVIREYTDTFANLFLIGRNGMHRYNNMDHSMLAAITAVGLYLDHDKRKEALWTVNADSDYQEEST